MRGLIFSMILVLPLLMACPALSEQEKWEGVDKAVIEKAAGHQGRQALETPLNTLEGDALLFVFITAGSLGGFAAGYYYRKLTERPPVNE